MREEYNICEDLSSFLNTNISLVDCKNKKISKNIIFYVPEEYRINNYQMEIIEKNIQENNLLCIIEKKIKIIYVVVSERNQNYFIIIGPFLIGNLSTDISNLLKSDIKFYEFYKNLKSIKVVSFQILINLIEGLFNKNYERSFSKAIKEIKLSENKNLKLYKKINEEIDYNAISQRYLYENLLLDNIKNGNEIKALFYEKKLSKEFDMGSRIPLDQLRAKKNGLYIEAGIIRKLLEDLKVPYVKIHLISSKYFYKIENATSLLELDKVKIDMITEYSKICFLQREKSGLKGIVNKALFFIEINLEKNIKVVDVANYCNVSVEHLSRVFKEEMKINLKKYINNEKIKFSIIFLKDRNYKISDIAIKLDFSSTELYVKNFKSIIGISPSEYRKSLK